jgi:hypothetical protein
MSNRVFFVLCGLLAVLFTALAAVMPQGLGARSPGPFGHAVEAPPLTDAEIAAREAAAKAAAALAGLRKSK